MKKDNFKNQILKFDPTHAPVEQVREWLYSIIDAELEKGEGIRDYNLIEECSDCEECLQDNTDLLSEEEYEKRIQSIISKSQNIPNSIIVSPHSKKRKHKFFKPFSILVATLSAALLSITIISAAQGITVREFISDNIKSLIGMKPGEQIENNGITMIQNGKPKIYSNIEEALTSTGFDIIYPHILPSGDQIEKVKITEGKNLRILITTTSQKLSITIVKRQSSSLEEWENSIKHSVNGVDFYIISADNTFQATANYNGFEYNVQYPDYDELIKILNSMLGVEP